MSLTCIVWPPDLKFLWPAILDLLAQMGRTYGAFSNMALWYGHFCAELVLMCQCIVCIVRNVDGVASVDRPRVTHKRFGLMSKKAVCCLLANSIVSPTPHLWSLSWWYCQLTVHLLTSCSSSLWRLLFTHLQNDFLVHGSSSDWMLLLMNRMDDRGTRSHVCWVQV